MNRMRGTILIALWMTACAHRSGDSAVRQNDQTNPEARAFCERWRALGDPADLGAALERARFALAQRWVPLTDGACMTPAQFSAEALQAAEVAAQTSPQDVPVLVVLSECRARFGKDRSGAAEAGCAAAALAPTDRQRLERCGDLLGLAGRGAEAIERWAGAVRLAEADDQSVYPLMDKLLAWSKWDPAVLASLPPAVVSGHQQWRETRAAHRSASVGLGREADAEFAEQQERARAAREEQQKARAAGGQDRDPEQTGDGDGEEESILWNTEDQNRRVQELKRQHRGDEQDGPYAESESLTDPSGFNERVRRKALDAAQDDWTWWDETL